MRRKKPDCMFCAHRNRNKEYVQQKTCTLGINGAKNCTRFIDQDEWKKYQEMLKGKGEDYGQI